MHCTTSPSHANHCTSTSSWTRLSWSFQPPATHLFQVGSHFDYLQLLLAPGKTFSSSAPSSKASSPIYHTLSFFPFSKSVASCLKYFHSRSRYPLCINDIYTNLFFIITPRSLHKKCLEIFVVCVCVCADTNIRMDSSFWKRKMKCRNLWQYFRQLQIWSYLSRKFKNHKDKWDDLFY